MRAERKRFIWTPEAEAIAREVGPSWESKAKILGVPVYAVRRKAGWANSPESRARARAAAAERDKNAVVAPTRDRRHWTHAEIGAIMSDEDDDRALAQRLGRSVNAVRLARVRHRRDETVIRRVGP